MSNSDDYKKDSYANNKEKIPLWLKLVFTFLFIVTIPSNICNYSAINLLWFCDIAIIIAFLGFWFESTLLISISALASVAPQLVWQIDYFFHLISGKRLFGFSDYMFDSNLSVFSKVVSPVSRLDALRTSLHIANCSLQSSGTDGSNTYGMHSIIAFFPADKRYVWARWKP
jgi:hypothetical protein